MFYKYNGSAVAEKIIRNGNAKVLNDKPVLTFKDDADFVAYHTKRNKEIYDLADDAYITDLVKNARISNFKRFGYADGSGATEVSADILEKFNKIQKESEELASSLYEIYAYDLSGSTLKIKNDSRVPAGKSLKEIYDSYAVVLTLGNDYSMRKKKATQPDIANSDSSICYKVSEVTDSEIKVLGEMTNSSGTWVLTNNAQAFKYTTTKTDSSATYVVETLGTINLDYASANNVPDMADAIVCSLVQ